MIFEQKQKKDNFLDKLPDVVDKETFDLQKKLIEESGEENIKHSEICDCEFSDIQMCFSYTLGIPDDILRNNYFNYRGFLKFLIDDKSLVEDDSGEFVLYGKYPNFEHMGLRAENNKVISKFGSGHVWKHELDKISEFYGKYNFYNLLDDVDIIKKVKEYSNKIGYKNQTE
ncbi:hypothetical protein ACFL22_00010 [Patescibacteria group bacterium]